jgi:hypothetical protein
MRIIIATFHNLDIDRITDITGVAGTVLQNHVVVDIADAFGRDAFSLYRTANMPSLIRQKNSV